MMTNQFIPILLYLIAAFAGAFGQYFYKLGGLQLGLVPFYRNGSLWIGVTLFCLVMVLFVSAFKLGGKMSIVYPVYATTFIWAAIIASVLGKEALTLMQLLGTFIIVLGVIVVTAGGMK